MEQFIKAIGIYPTGSVVELDTNEVGIIVESKPGSRLSPKLLLITDKHRDQLSKPKVINLEENRYQQKIARTLPSSAVSITVISSGFGGWARFSA